MKQRYVDGVLVTWGSRLFWPGNRVQGRFSGPSSVPRDFAVLTRPRPTAAAVRGFIRTTLRRTPQVMVKVTGGGRGMQHIAAHLRYISRRGTLSLENERGEKFSGNEALKELREDWRVGGSEIPDLSKRREAFNIVLSMPRETDGKDVLAAAREFAKREFSNHAWAMVLHEPGVDPDTDRPHVHLAVRAEGFDRKRLNPRKADLARWRDTFAGELRERGVEATATRRAVRGETLRAYPNWQAHAKRRNGMREVQAFELEQQKVALKAWREISTALARSEEPADRESAKEIVQFLSATRAARVLAANADRAVEPELVQRRVASRER